MSEIKVSVIVPAFNASAFLERCLDSVIVARKNYPIEIIVIDDGSTDNTLDICKKYENSNQNIITVSHENKGLSGARNSGIAKAKGLYISFVDSDDTITPDYFDKLYPLMNEKKEIIHFGYNKISEKGIISYPSEDVPVEKKEISEILANSSSNKFLWYVWRRVYTKSLLDNNQIVFDEELKYGEDSIFMLSVLSNIKRGGVKVSDCLYNYYDTPESLTNIKYKEDLLQKFELQYERRKNISFPDIDQESIKRDIAKNYIEHTLFAILSNLRNSNTDKYKEVQKVRSSIIYRESFMDYRYSSSTGIKRYILIKLFQYRLFGLLFKALKIKA